MVLIIRGFLSIIMSVLFVFSGCFVGNFKAPFKPKKENCALNFAVISDVHIDDSAARQGMLELGFYDMEHSRSELDALVISGDITDHGNRSQYEKVEEAFSRYKPAKNIILAVGNHDTWNEDVEEEHGYEESKKLFIEYNKKIANRDIDKFNYSTVVNGYTFIAIGADSSRTDTDLSNEQLAWLKAELDKASKSGLPIFVISHWALKDTHGLPVNFLGFPLFKSKDDVEDTEGSFSSNAEELRALLDNYKNIFFISGHLHNGFSNNSKLMKYPYSSVEAYGNITSINLPCYMYAGIKGVQIPGIGFQFEVYENEVLIRGRSYTSDIWYTLYEYSVEIN